MKKTLFVLFFYFLFSHSHLLFAQIGGDHTYDFLNLTTTARVAALGGNLISVKDGDLNLALQNPAVLDSNMHNQLSMTYVDYLADVRYGYAVYSRTYKKIGSFSAGLQYLDYGKFIAADETGAITGTFSAGDEYSLNLSYGKTIVDSVFSVGATLKSIYSKISTYSSFGNAIDLGGIYTNRKHLFSAALVIKNFGKEWKAYNVVHEPLPFEVQLGISKKLAHAPFRISLTGTHLEKWDLTYVDPEQIQTDPITGAVIQKSNLSIFSDKLARHLVVGGEIILSKSFHLDVGYNYERRQEMKLQTHPGIVGFSFGFGLRISKFHLSYAFSKYNLAGSPNLFTIATNFSDFYTRKESPAKQP